VTWALLPVTAQLPLQVKRHVPVLHVRLEFGPAVNVHMLPLQMTWQVSPQVPTHAVPVLQVNAHDEVVASQGEVRHVTPSGHVHAWPWQSKPCAGVQAQHSTATHARTRSITAAV
jgi:hypothetical protein